jgi:hypothetical protein
MKLKINLLVASVAAVSAAQGALYTSTFDAPFVPNAEVVGVDGWFSNSNTVVTNVGSLNGSPALALGGFNVPQTVNTKLTQSFVESVGRVSATFDFALVDSTVDGYDRDTFGFSFYDTTGSSVFAVKFIPTVQGNAGTTVATYEAFYSYNNGANQTLSISFTDTSLFSMSVVLSGAFTPGNTTTVNHKVTIDGLERNGAGTLNPNTTLDSFGFTFDTFDAVDPTFAGDNFMIVDNLTVVPEVSSSLLLALSGLGMITRRRRA